jgi:dipeptidyl aminopeptidase/acylaminoacyl peptidase
MLAAEKFEPRNPMQSHFRFQLFIALILHALFAPGIVAAERITLEDLDTVVGLSSPQVSPDGQSVVVLVSRVNLEENRDERQLVLIDVASGERQPLTHDRPGVRRPRWSPDGQHLAFIDAHGKEDRKPQVLVLSMEGGEARAVTSAPRGVVAFEWSAEGDAVFYLGAEAAPEAPEGPERHNRAFSVGYHDYLATEAPPVLHLWSQDLEGGDAQRINGEDVVAVGGQFSWMTVAGDGQSIAFTGAPPEALGDMRKSRLMVIDLATGQLRDGFGDDLDHVLWGEFSSNGEMLAYASHSGGNPFYSSPAISVAGADGAEGEIVSPTIDRGLWGARWMPDGQALLIGGNDDARKSLWLQPLDGAPRKLELDGLNAVTRYGPPDLDIGSNGAIAMIASNSTRPPELYWLDTVDSAPRPLTDFNTALGERNLGRSEEIRWVDGRWIPGQRDPDLPAGLRPGQALPAGAEDSWRPHVGDHADLGRLRSGAGGAGHARVRAQLPGQR